MQFEQSPRRTDQSKRGHDLSIVEIQRLPKRYYRFNGAAPCGAEMAAAKYIHRPEQFFNGASPHRGKERVELTTVGERMIFRVPEKSRTILRPLRRSISACYRRPDEVLTTEFDPRDGRAVDFSEPGSRRRLSRLAE